MLKIFIFLMVIYTINTQTLLRQNWDWPSSQFNQNNKVVLIDEFDVSLTPPPPPPIPTVDLNGSLDSLINQLNYLISLRNLRRRQIQQWQQSLVEKQVVTGLPISSDEFNYADDPWDVVVVRLIKAIVGVISKATALNLLPFV